VLSENKRGAHQVIILRALAPHHAVRGLAVGLRPGGDDGLHLAASRAEQQVLNVGDDVLLRRAGAIDRDDVEDRDLDVGHHASGTRVTWHSAWQLEHSTGDPAGGMVPRSARAALCRCIALVPVGTASRGRLVIDGLSKGD
jgi:hypothetical protein